MNVPFFADKLLALFSVDIKFILMMLKVYNFSTGRSIYKQILDDEVTAMDHDHTGQLLFCGDAQVVLHTGQLFFDFFMNIILLNDVCRDVYIL